MFNLLITWTNNNQGFVTAILSFMTIVISVVSIVVAIIAIRAPFKKKLLIRVHPQIPFDERRSGNIKTFSGIRMVVINVGNRSIIPTDFFFVWKGKQIKSYTAQCKKLDTIRPSELVIIDYTYNELLERTKQLLGNTFEGRWYGCVIDTEEKKFRFRAKNLEKFFKKNKQIRRENIMRQGNE